MGVLLRWRKIIMEKTIGISAIERRRRRNRTINTVFRYVVLIFVAIIMIYPILWLIGASFKTNNEIFTSLGFIPSKGGTPSCTICICNRNFLKHFLR